MLKEHKKSFSRLFRFFDILIILLSLIVAYYIRFEKSAILFSNWSFEFEIFSFSYIIAWLFVSNYLQLYKSMRFSNFLDDVWNISKTNSICLLVALLPTFFFRNDPLSRLFIFYFWGIQTGSLISLRLFTKIFLRYIRLRGYNYRQVVIVGCNGRAKKIVDRFKKSPALGIRVLDTIDYSTNGKCPGFSDQPCRAGGLEDLKRIIKDHVVDEVVITLPMKSFYSEIEQIIAVCEKVGVEVKIPTDLFNVKLAQSSITNYHDIQVIDFFTSPKMTPQLIIKRWIDVLVSGILLLVLSPIFLLIGLLIKMSSKGPVLFIQQRIGYNGRYFDFLKFRSMVENAEALKKDLAQLNEQEGPVFKIKNDPRVTKVGNFLRKTSMDELPQLFNVLKGDMSLVGPRPPVPGEVSEYELETRRRLSMRPGITCLWQVNGRNSIPFEKWMELDRKYIDNWTLWLDVKILFQTIPAVFRGI